MARRVRSIRPLERDLPELRTGSREPDGPSRGVGLRARPETETTIAVTTQSTAENPITNATPHRLGRPPRPECAERDRPGINDHPDAHDPAAEMVGGRELDQRHRRRIKEHGTEAGTEQAETPPPARPTKCGRSLGSHVGNECRPGEAAAEDDHAGDRQPLLASQAAERGDDEGPGGRADAAAGQQHAVAVHARVRRPRGVGRDHRFVAHADNAEERHQHELGEDPPVLSQVAQAAQELARSEGLVTMGRVARRSRIDRTAAIAAR